MYIFLTVIIIILLKHSKSMIFSGGKCIINFISLLQFSIIQPLRNSKTFYLGMYILNQGRIEEKQRCMHCFVATEKQID